MDAPITNSTNLGKILVPTDFSEISIDALEYAAMIARQGSAEILLLHVFESYSQNTMLDMVVDFTDIVEKGIRDKMEEIKQRNPSLEGVTIHSRVTVGKIYAEIDKIAREENMDLVVMGTHGVSGTTNIGKFIIGSNSYRIIHNAPCPIITLREDPWRKTFKNFLLPIDNSKESLDKVDIAIRWAKFFGATIHVLAVTAFFEGLILDKDIDLKTVEVKGRLDAAGIPNTTDIIRHRAPSSSVISKALDVNADLIIMVTGQESPLTEMLFGSSARNIISESTIPVLSVNIREYREV